MKKIGPLNGLRKTIPCALFFLLSMATMAQKTVSFSVEKETPMIQFALNDLRDGLYNQGMAISQSKTSDVRILLAIEADLVNGKFRNEPLPKVDFELKSEGFTLKKDQQNIWIIGADEPGLMYGILELSEQIKLVGLNRIENTNQNPYMPTRGVKFNLPLDIRTPTYSDPCQSAKEGLADMWSMDFWSNFIDHMARHRYNMISMWNLHPFPSMVKVPEYPDAAIDDVLYTKGNFHDAFYDVGNGKKYDHLLEDTYVVLEMTIEEKIAHWRRVMRYAKDRNVDIFFMTWNIFNWGVEGKYGITESIDNEITVDYYRKSIRQFIQTYPDLAGIGLTVGENMVGSSLEKKEKWAFETYGQGVLDALKKDPERELFFIHRLHQGDVPTISSAFMPLIDHKNVDFIFSFKYAQAHIMSSINQPFCEPVVKEFEAQGAKTLWTLRNDDNFYFRWGAPDFARDFIKNIPYDVSQGYYYGSDGYVWAREYLAKDKTFPRTMEVDKHWYHWMMIGRLGYNPEMSNERFVQMLGNRFPQAESQKLFDAWQHASMIYPITTGFHWGAADFSWYIEGSTSHPAGTFNRSGIHNVEQFIKQGVHDGTDNQTIPQYVKMIKDKKSTDKTTPIQVSEKLHNHSDQALALLEQMPKGEGEELRKTLADIRSISYLGKHYAHKISGSTYQALYNETGKKPYQKKTVEELEAALKFWTLYADNASEQYINPVWMKRVGWTDWERFKEVIKKDIEIAKQEN